MKFSIDTDAQLIQTIDNDGTETSTPLYSAAGFRLLSRVWLKQEWNQLHWQSFSWFGFPVLQFPDDLLRLQEVVVALAPDVIVETGVARGGSSIFFASICRLLGKGQVISIDVAIPRPLRHRIESSSFGDLITLIEGDSTSPEIVAQVHEAVRSASRVFVFLDSDHSKAHVRRELDAYAALVTPGSYIVATDGVMQSLADTPRGSPHWRHDNPAAAAREFAATHPEFTIRRPAALFGDIHVVEELSYWPDAWLLRCAD